MFERITFWNDEKRIWIVKKRMKRRKQTKNERIDIDNYKKWVHKYYENIYVKYQPTEEQLNMSFQNQAGNYHLSGIIPKYTFEQYLNMIGEGYNG